MPRDSRRGCETRGRLKNLKVTRSNDDDAEVQDYWKYPLCPDFPELFAAVLAMLEECVSRSQHYINITDELSKFVRYSKHSN